MNQFAQECEREAIHIPGAVQPFGGMVVADAEGRICAVSANSLHLLGQAPASLLNRPKDGLVAQNGARLKWHMHNGLHIGEVEPTPEFAALSPPARNDALRGEVSQALASMDAADGVVVLCDRVVEHVQRMTGFDRVMLYRFDSDWNGEVVAEVVLPGVHAYLGQRFPASDIPAQARAMLCLNRVRLIPDAIYTPVPLVQRDSTPIDMGLALVRSVSPVHLEYLANMGVRASLTLSILCDGRLWGLVACHHRTPLYVSDVARDSCEIVARLMTALIPAKHHAEENIKHRHLSSVLERLQGYLGRSQDFVVGLVRHLPNVLDILLVEGASAAICFEEKWTLLGEVPTLTELRGLVAWLSEHHGSDEVFSTDQLSHLYPPAAQFAHKPCGLMAMSLPKTDGDYVLWFLPELVQTIPWAGEPDKLMRAEDGCGLHPRKSFRMWQQTVRGRSRPIEAAEREAAVLLRKAMVEADLAVQFSREREARAQMSRERHRLAFLAEAGAVLSESLDTRRTLRDFAELAARSVCDWCVVCLHRDGVLLREVVRHRTPEGQVVADELLKFPPLRDAPESPLHEVFTARQTVLLGRVTPQWCERLAPMPEYAQFLQHRLGIRSVIVAPLVARDQLLGVIKLVRSELGTRYGADDVPWIQDVARRVAHAIDNALLYQGAQQAIQAREHVMGVVSHDLKNPLGAIQINSQRLGRLLDGPQGDPAFSERAQNSVHRIDQSCRRMHGLIEDVLNVSRLEAGKSLLLEKTSVAADSLLRDVFDMLEPLAADRKVCLSVHNRAVDCHVVCEPERLMQVFSNLVGNAIKFTPEGGDVTVELIAADIPTFSIRDTGPGIALADQGHIFDRFWQAKRTARQGAGLGLAIAKGIVEAHGGEIWVQSTEGRGTTFYFTVPT